MSSMLHSHTPSAIPVPVTMQHFLIGHRIVGVGTCVTSTAALVMNCVGVGVLVLVMVVISPVPCVTSTFALVVVEIHNFS